MPKDGVQITFNQIWGSGNGMPGLRTWLCFLAGKPCWHYWYSDQTFLDPY